VNESHGLAEEVAAALRIIAPSGVHVGARAIDAEDERLQFDEELLAVGSSVRKRRSEFATGRVLLRQVIGQDVPIPVGPGRRPVLPDGVVASLAHDDRIAVAAACAAKDATFLGIDIESIGVLPPEAAAEILRSDDTTDDAILAFVLKEAAYKAWSARGGRMLNYHEVRVDAAGGVFTATVEPCGTTLGGRYIAAGDSWLALVVVGSLSRDQSGVEQSGHHERGGGRSSESRFWLSRPRR